MTKTTPPNHGHTRDGAGHLDPAYAREIDARCDADSHTRDAEVLGFTDAEIHGDSLAEELGEDYVRVATSGEPDAEDQLDEVTVEELGGPFVETTAREEVSCDPDAVGGPTPPAVERRLDP